MQTTVAVAVMLSGKLLLPPMVFKGNQGGVHKNFKNTTTMAHSTRTSMDGQICYETLGRANY
jgi:hypothetical protein